MAHELDGAERERFELLMAELGVTEAGCPDCGGLAGHTLDCRRAS
jgi:hypothetical protein